MSLPPPYHYAFTYTGAYFNSNKTVDALEASLHTLFDGIGVVQTKRI